MSTKETIPWARNLFLGEWQEIVGVLMATRTNNHTYEVYIRSHDEVYRLVYPAESKEAAILKESLRGMKEKLIGILKTDLEDMPVVVRVG